MHISKSVSIITHFNVTYGLNNITSSFSINATVAMYIYYKILLDGCCRKIIVQDIYNLCTFVTRFTRPSLWYIQKHVLETVASYIRSWLAIS